MVDKFGFPETEEEDENANLTRLFNALYEGMMEHYYADRDSKAQEIAHDLLRHANLPLYPRAASHMVLATYYQNPCLWHATQAIRILQEQVFVVDPEFPRSTLTAAQNLLHAAQEYCQETGRQETNEPGDDDFDFDDSEDDEAESEEVESEEVGREEMEIKPVGEDSVEAESKEDDSLDQQALKDYAAQLPDEPIPVFFADSSPMSPSNRAEAMRKQRAGQDAELPDDPTSDFLPESSPLVSPSIMKAIREQYGGLVSLETVEAVRKQQAGQDAALNE